ncbi:BQ2448_3798 [Microbotryum intermedium]|uniref:BQ2448_3798 protein n=1 Tax=Microbotryum intermedium TaxID=269621 RepID=A0A238FIY5_9BASI|nr:BQ2448_3798 [Microbotryum intermedium]
MAKHVTSDSEDDLPHSSAKRLRTSSSLPRSSPPELPSLLDDGAADQVVDDEQQDADAGEQAGEEAEEDDFSMDDASDNDEEAVKRKQDLLEKMKARSRGQGAVAQRGIIERVELQNFMCHKLTTVDFGPQINFLVGNNGSGKSAILTGITMALGGNARATNRATKGSGLVMEGATVAKCSVKLRNRGPEAYKHHVYGDSITIERTLRLNGGGSYKIFNAEGGLVDGNRATLDSILDAFNIQVENPMTVLTQDQSRQFLASASAQQKYNFFLKGTQLAQLTEEYETIQTNTQTMQAAVDKKQEIIPDLKDAYKRAKERAKDAEAAVGQQDKLEQLKNRLAWCGVEEAEANIATGEEMLHKEEDTVTKIASKLQEFEANKARADASIADCEEAQKETQLEKDEKEPALKQLKDKIHASREKAREWNQTTRTASATIQRQKDQIADYERQIAKEKKRLEVDVEAMQRPVRERITRLEEENLARVQVISAAVREIDELEIERTRLVGEMDEVKAKIRAASDDAQTIQGRIRNAQASKNNTMLAYGQAIPALLKVIDADRGWNQKPLGPMGRYIELTDRKWGPLIESVGGQTFNAFVVATESDCRRLFTLFQKHRIDHKTPIIKLAHDPSFDCSSSEPDRDILTVLRALKFSNEHVRQAFINAIQPENSVLVPKRAEGDRLFDVGKRNIRVVFSQDMFQITRYENRAGTRVVDPWRGAARISPNFDDQVQRCQDDLKRVQGHLNEFETQRKAIDQQFVTIHRKKEGLERSCRAEKDAMIKTNREIEKQRQQLQEREPSNISALEELRDQCQAELDTTLAQWEDAMRLHEASLLEENGTETVLQMRQMEDEVKKVDKLLKSIMEQLNKAIRDRVNAESAIAQYNARLSAQEQKIDDLRASVEREREKLAHLTEQASEICDRPQGGQKQSEAQLRKQIDSLQKALKNRERQQGATIEEILTELSNRKNVLVEAKATVASLNVLVKALTSAYQTRVARWTDFRDQISARAKLQFMHHLSARGFTGKLQFDHNHMRLNLRVQTEGGEKRNHSKQKDAKSLSGGEKSFSTICLLLTMWEAVGCPLRCLDEFDVFMDAVNRRISMKMMVDTAKAADEVQFILITPQSMSGSTYGPEVRITKLGDPNRSQGRLAFGTG